MGLSLDDVTDSLLHVSVRGSRGVLGVGCSGRLPSDQRFISRKENRTVAGDIKLQAAPTL